MMEVHDAYDANRDGHFIRLFARLQHESGVRLTVPGFAMQHKPGGEWSWRIRWSARRIGRWTGKVVLHLGQGKRNVRQTYTLKKPIQVLPNPGVHGPLVRPRGKQNKRFLRRLQQDGSSRALWLWGACRAWVVWGNSAPKQWLRYEGIDREKELFPLLRNQGYNVLNQWMAPWEFLLIHRDRASFWKHKKHWRRKPYALREVWRSYATYDQGRALAFDKLLQASEGDAKHPTLYLLLSPMAHQNFQLREHPWGSQESGWSPENDKGRQTLNKLNGFSGYRPKMSVWSFFEADPQAPLSDPKSQLFDYQANYYRYLIARWSYSRALGMWVLLDELDAVGGEVGDLFRKTGWWRRPDPSRWLGQIITMFRGRLQRSDGLRYQGDPFQHPLHAATTSFGGGISAKANVEWKGPKQAPFDLYGWHWYPDIGSGTDLSYIVERALPETIRGILRYSQVRLPGPRLISEFGSEERDSPLEKPNALYPSLYQVGIWSSVLAGHAGSVMDWDDGKLFGELKWKSNNKAFSKLHYGIDLTQRTRALQRFLLQAQPGRMASTAEPGSHVTIAWQSKEKKSFARSYAIALYDRHTKHRMWGWLYAPSRNKRFVLNGLPSGMYRLQWFDSWTGQPFLKARKVRINQERSLLFDASGVLRRLKAKKRSGAARHRLTQGVEVAFQLLRLP